MAKKDSLRELAKAGRIRNRLLSAAALRKELCSAAERVMRLSEAGSDKRFFTLVEVAEDSGLKATAIVKEIIRIQGITKRKTSTR
jgi:hypothetical protein